MNANHEEECNEVKNRINRRFDELLVTRADGTVGAHVCIVCDRLLKPKQVCRLGIDCLGSNADLLLLPSGIMYDHFLPNVTSLE